MKTTRRDFLKAAVAAPIMGTFPGSAVFSGAVGSHCTENLFELLLDFAATLADDAHEVPE